MSDQPVVGIGERVAERRKLNGVTQVQFAHRAHVSLSLLRKVEQGSVPASPAFVSAAARALGVAPAELLGQPYRRDTPADQHVFAAIPALRRELNVYLIPPQDDILARGVDQLAKAVAVASQLRHAVDLTGLAALLPGLLAELRAASHATTGSARERVFGCWPKPTTRQGSWFPNWDTPIWHPSRWTATSGPPSAAVMSWRSWWGLTGPAGTCRRAAGRWHFGRYPDAEIIQSQPRGGQRSRRPSASANSVATPIAMDRITGHIIAANFDRLAGLRRVRIDEISSPLGTALPAGRDLPRHWVTGVGREEPYRRDAASILRRSRLRAGCGADPRLR